jgi:mediator of RNA polymerase II transcription subunit 14
MSDAARKRHVANWVVATKKQVVKLYAVAKWSRDSDVVQKAMVSSCCFLKSPVLISLCL